MSNQTLKLCDIKKLLSHQDEFVKQASKVMLSEQAKKIRDQAVLGLGSIPVYEFLNKQQLEVIRNSLGLIKDFQDHSEHIKAVSEAALGVMGMGKDFEKISEALGSFKRTQEIMPKLYDEYTAIGAAASALMKNYAFQEQFSWLEGMLKNPSEKAFLEKIKLTEIKTEVFFDYENLDKKIQDELAEATDFKSLSNQAKKYAIWFFIQVFLPFLIGTASILTASYIEKNYINASEKLKTTTSRSELKCLLKGGEPTVDSKALGDYRVISGDKVRLREGPNMKSMVMLELPIYTLVRVLDKSQRSWLEIEVELGNETLRGWVNRRYTEYFR